MKEILSAPWMVDMVRTATEMYQHGWDERNGGNISLLLEEEQVRPYLAPGRVVREIPTGFSCPALDGRFFLVTGTGKYFKNVQYAPEVNLGLVRLADGGANAQLLIDIRIGQIHLGVSGAHVEQCRAVARRCG